MARVSSEIVFVRHVFAKRARACGTIGFAMAWSMILTAAAVTAVLLFVRDRRRDRRKRDELRAHVRTVAYAVFTVVV